MPSYEVDVGGFIARYSLARGWIVTVWNANPGEFAPGQWFRLSPHLEAGNLPGISIVIADTANSGRSGEGVFIDGNGNQNAAMTIKNTTDPNSTTAGNGTALLGINWLSTPSHF
jgi:hypothetical protein